jgi:hypothetical protein
VPETWRDLRAGLRDAQQHNLQFASAKVSAAGYPTVARQRLLGALGELIGTPYSRCLDRPEHTFQKPSWLCVEDCLPD